MITKVLMELETNTVALSKRPLRVAHKLRVKLEWYNDGELEGTKYFTSVHDAALWIVEEEVRRI